MASSGWAMRPQPFGRVDGLDAPPVANIETLFADLQVRQPSDCKCDTKLYPPTCPTCKTGQICESTLVPLKCGISCMSNQCIGDISGGRSNGGRIGGAVGGALGVVAIAGLLFLVWRTRARRREIARQQARNDAKVRAAAGKKFRPGQQANLSSSAASADGRSVGTSGSQEARNGLAGSNALSELEEVDEDDVEYTELRPDGLTTYRKNDESEQDTLGALVGLGVNRRYSTSAATHLSRISEGVEVDDDEESTMDARSIRAGSTRTGRMSIRRKLFNINNSNPSLAPTDGGVAMSTTSSRATQGTSTHAPSRDEHAVQHQGSASFSSSAGNAASGGGRRRGSSSSGAAGRAVGEGPGPITGQLLPISSGDGSTCNIVGPTQPIQAHRTTGAPLIELNKGKSSTTRGSGGTGANCAVGPASANVPTGTILDLDAPPSPMSPALAEGGRAYSDARGSMAMRAQSQIDPYSRESGWYSPAAPSTAASRHFDFPDRLGSDPARDAAFDQLMARESSSNSTYAKSVAESTMVRSEAAHDGSDVEVPDVDTMPPLPSQYASAPGSTAMAGASHRHLSTATFASSGSSVSMDYVLSSKIVTPLTPGSAKRVQVANGGKPELVRSFSGNSKGKVRSKRYNSNAATAGSSVGDDDEQGGMTPTSSELAHGGADPFDDEAAVRASMDEPEPRALKNSGPMVVQGSGAASSNPRAATAGFSRSDMGRSGTTTASFGIPIFDGSHYAQGLPLHSFIDPRSGSSAALDANRPSWFDEDGDLVDATEVAAPTVPGGAAPSVSGRAVRARNNSGPHHRPGKDVRQSTASSIGGLSVFDGIPFHLEHGEMPANAAEAVVAARAHQQQRDREQIAHSAARCSLDTDAGDADFAPPPRYAPAAGPASGVLRDEKEQGSGHGIPSADTAFSGITTFEPSTGNATAGTGKSTTSGCSQSSAATAMPRLGTPLKADLEGAPTTTTASVYSMPSAAPTTEESLRTSSTNTSGPSISSSQATHGSSNAVRVNLPPRINEGLDEYSPELPGLQ